MTRHNTTGMGYKQVPNTKDIRENRYFKVIIKIRLTQSYGLAMSARQETSTWKMMTELQKNT